MIIIAYSFGGLPVIHALRRSRDDPDKWGNTFQFTSGLVLFGVPFRGRDGPSVKKWVKNIKKYHKDPNVQIWSETMSTSIPGSQYLGELLSQYTETRVDHPIPVSCFWELDPSPVGKVWGDQNPNLVGHITVFFHNYISMLSDI